MGKKEKVFILGGGITGLAAAYFLQKKNPFCQITLFEKQNRLGGWIETVTENGYRFEKGPRTFRYGHCPYLLNLIEDLGLPILLSDKSAAKRYLWHHGKLRSMSSFLPMLLPHFFREPFIAKSVQDESIYEFAARRFSPKIAETLFDPLTLGIYAGDIRKLSIRACFPALYQWEQEKGSLLLGMLFSKKKAKGLFTLAAGMQSLVDALEKKLSISICLNAEAKQVEDKKIYVNGAFLQADRVISALPFEGPKTSIWVVNLAFKGQILPKKGFGYLVPTKEKEAVLGAIFDSCIFPNSSPDTLLTFMVRPEEKAPLQAVLSALRRHLNISATPAYTSSYLAQDAIPQYHTGTHAPHGVSLEAAVERASKIISI